MPQRKSISRAQTLLLALILWSLLALLWSWFLLSHSYQHFLDESLLSRAQAIAATLASSNSPEAAPLDAALSLDPSLAYIMVWSEDGRVLQHTRRDLVASYLDEKQWPALDPQQSSRTTSLITLLAPNSAPTPVLEVTLPLPRQAAGASAPTAPTSRTFLSLAIRRDAADAQFQRATRPLLLTTLLLTLAGGILLTAGILLAFRRLEKSRREIEQNARARTSLLTERGMLASVLAHEVRSPLTALRFNLHTLRSLLASQSQESPSPDSTPDKQTELTDRCEREIQRLDRMLNDFLMRTQVITAPDAPAGASINTVIQEAIDFLAPALERQHIRISLHLDPSNPRVPVQPDELRQVILNLAANAQDAMPAPKGGTLAISTLSAPGAPSAPGSAGGPAEFVHAAESIASPVLESAPTPQHSSVTLLIRDSGIGIPPELCERIFEPFFSTKPNGSGLGLALVRRVISGAGGSVFCESAPPPTGKGTTFRILLPAAPPPESP